MTKKGKAKDIPSFGDGGMVGKPPAKPKAPQRVKLTNKAGAGATPLAKDIDAWLAKGWFRAD